MGIKWCEGYARIHLHLVPLSLDTDKSRFAPIAPVRYFMNNFVCPRASNKLVKRRSVLRFWTSSIHYSNNTLRWEPKLQLQRMRWHKMTSDGTAIREYEMFLQASFEGIHIYLFLLVHTFCRNEEWLAPATSPISKWCAQRLLPSSYSSETEKGVRFEQLSTALTYRW